MITLLYLEDEADTKDIETEILLAAALHPQFKLGWIKLLEDNVTLTHDVEEIAASVK